MPDRNPLPLPLTLEEIDRGWLTAALRTRAPDVTVRDSGIVDVNRGTCTKIRVRLEMDEAGKRAGIPGTVIVKGGFEPHSRDMHHMHESEVRGYRDVNPALKLPSPVCYFAGCDPERKQGIVIMEDLVARGVAFCNPLVPQTHEEVARRLTVLARHHAQTWGSPELEPGGLWDWVPNVAISSQTYFKQWLEPETWGRFVNSPRGAAASVRFHDSAWMADAIDRIAIRSSRLPHSVLHGDTHLGNLYVDTDGTPAFFDSLPHRGPAMIEVSYHVCCALDTADRRRWEGSLVQHYIEELDRNGVSRPDFDEAMLQYGAFLAYGYCVFIVNESFFQSEAINTAYTARFSSAMIDHDTIGLLKAIV